MYQSKINHFIRDVSQDYTGLMDQYGAFPVIVGTLMLAITAWVWFIR